MVKSSSHWLRILTYPLWVEYRQKEKNTLERNQRTEEREQLVNGVARRSNRLETAFVIWEQRKSNDLCTSCCQAGLSQNLNAAWQRRWNGAMAGLLRLYSHKRLQTKQVRDVLNYSRLLALQRVEMGLQGLQKALWGLRGDKERLIQQAETH